MASLPTDHGALMDRVYRGQRHIYDVTRKYYLFGRDRLIAELACPDGAQVLEIGCGTGRNLARIGKVWKGARLHGLDISAEMLMSARAKLGANGRLALGDATCFDPAALFDRAGFDRVILSYALSMIPDWEAALDRATAALAPRGALCAVDFGDLEGLPHPLRALLRAWLARFHVTPRADLVEAATRIAGKRGLRLTMTRGPLGYYRMIRMER